jgi:hypothetical protein
MENNEDRMLEMMIKQSGGGVYSKDLSENGTIIPFMLFRRNDVLFARPDMKRRIMEQIFV